jgi:hypothetical protein
VVITAKGGKLLEKIDAYGTQMDEIMMNLTEAEAGMLNKLLDKVRDSGGKDIESPGRVTDSTRGYTNSTH